MGILVHLGCWCELAVAAAHRSTILAPECVFDSVFDSKAVTTGMYRTRSGLWGDVYPAATLADS